MSASAPAIRLVIEFGSFTNPDPTPYDAWIDTCRGCLTPLRNAAT